MNIEKNSISQTYDLVFEHKFPQNIGFQQTKNKNLLSLNAPTDAKVMKIIINVQDFLDAIWKKTEVSGMAQLQDIRALISSHQGHIRSIYPIPEYTF